MGIKTRGFDASWAFLPLQFCHGKPASQDLELKYMHVQPE
jgi:hypothetical protein